MQQQNAQWLSQLQAESAPPSPRRERRTTFEPGFTPVAARSQDIVGGEMQESPVKESPAREAPVAAPSRAVASVEKPAAEDESPARETPAQPLRALIPVQASAWAAVLVTVLAALWLGLFPLLCKYPKGYVQNTHFKWIAMMALTGVTVLASAVPAVLERRRIRWRDAGRTLCVAFFAWMGLSVLFGSGAELVNRDGQHVVWIGSGRYEGMSTQLCYCGIFLALSLIRPKMRALCAAAAAGLIAFFAVVMGQYAGYNVLELFPSFPEVFNTRVTYEFQGTIGNIDMVSGYLCLMVPLLLGTWLDEGGRIGLLTVPAGLLGVMLMLMMEVQSGMLALMGCCVLLAGTMLRLPRVRSRGFLLLGCVLACVTLRSLIGLPWLDGLSEPWNLPMRPDIALPQCRGDEQVVFPWAFSPVKLAPLAGTAACLALSAWFRRHRGHEIALAPTVMLLALTLLIAVLLVGVADIPESAGAVYEIHEVLNGRMLDSFGSGRLGVWRKTLETARQHLLFGTGPDTFRALVGDEMYRAGLTPGQTFDNPHNMFLAIAMQSGLPALLLFLAGMGALVIGAWRQRGGLGLAAAVLAYLAQGMFSFSICLVTPMFWAMAGLCVALARKRVYVSPAECGQ